MENWFEMMENDQTLLADFEAKVNEDDSEEVTYATRHYSSRENAWVRKRLHRKKMTRDFLSLNPGMKVSDVAPLDWFDGVLIDDNIATNGGTYVINHVNHIFVAPGGHLETFRGAMEHGYKGRLCALGSKRRDAGKITNRRIRHMENGEGRMNYSVYKKMYSPVDPGIV